MRLRIFAPIAFLLVFAPLAAHAAPHLIWGDPEWDPDTGDLIETSVTRITDDSDVSLPFGVSKWAWIEYVPGRLGTGPLYFVPPGGSREFIGTIGGYFGLGALAWTREGTYELDVYVAPPFVVTQSKTARIFAWLFGEHAHAQEAYDFIGTIRFTVHNGPVSHTLAPSVLFIPGIKGSVLKTGSDTLWPPSVWSSDVLKLALTTTGSSTNPIVVDGPLEAFYSTPIYSGFTSFMDALVADGTVSEWEPLAYDWRFSPEQILADGIKTSSDILDPIQEVERLARKSHTGKVVIIAHSMGGLLGKALIKKLEDKGEANLIDSFVMVGTPQLGTPQSIASLLHGGGESILGGYIVDAEDVRTVAQNFESAYDLLPSPHYFDDVLDAPISFSTTAAFTLPWRMYWGTTTDTYPEFASFLTATGVARAKPAISNLEWPETLRTNLVQKAHDFHSTYDTYTPPPSIHVVQVAGWGIPTTKAVSYLTQHGSPSYETLFTREGDGTVVYPSALSSVTDETYFFNVFDYNDAFNPDVQHRDLLSASSTQEVIKTIIAKKAVATTAFITKTKPEPGSVADQLIVSTHSPVILGAYDQSGHFTGIDPHQDLKAEVLSITQDIPGSTFTTSGDNQYIFLPKTGIYTFEFKGVGSGPTTVTIENFANDLTTPIASYSEIPVTTNTSATFTVDMSAPQNTSIQVDSNSDGTADMLVSSDASTPTLEALTANLKAKLQSMIGETQLKAILLKKLAAIEAKINKQHKTEVGAVGHIDEISLPGLQKLITELQAHTGTYPIDPALILKLKNRIDALALLKALKISLLEKVSRLQKIVPLAQTLSNMLEQVTIKGTDGKVSDTNTRGLYTTLDQIEKAL